MTTNPGGKGDRSWERHEERRAARDAARQARDSARQARDSARSQRRDGSDGPGTRVSANLDLTGVNRVQVDHTAGKLLIRQAASGEAAAVSASSSKQAPELVVERQGDSLVIHVKLSMGRLFRRRQGAQAEVVLPGGLGEVRIDMGYGKVEMSNFEARQLRLHVGAGDVVISHVSGDLAVEVGAGRVSVDAHAGTVRCETGTGDVSVGVAEASPGNYEITTGMGGAELRLPPGLQVTARVSSGIGQTKIDYPVGGSDAPIHVVVNTGIGRALLRAETAARSTAPGRPGVRPQRPGRPASAAGSDAAEMRVIQLLEQGRISAREAADLIAALKGQAPPDEDGD